MKKAKVREGVVQQVWPWTKVLPDGTTVVKELPNQYRPEKLGKYPDCIVDVPDEVQPKWRWDGEKYVAPMTGEEKRSLPPVLPHSDLLEVVSEKLGIPYDDLWAEVQARKKARRTGTRQS